MHKHWYSQSASIDTPSNCPLFTNGAVCSIRKIKRAAIKMRVQAASKLGAGCRTPKALRVLHQKSRNHIPIVKAGTPKPLASVREQSARTIYVPLDPLRSRQINASRPRLLVMILYPVTVYIGGH